MPLSTPNLQSCTDRLNHMATEIAIAKPGDANSVVPLYSLLSELSDFTKEEELLLTACKALENRLNGLLDTGAPIDGATIEYASGFIEWAQDALDALSQGEEYAPFEFTDEEPSSTKSSTGPTLEVDGSVDSILELNPSQDQELLQEFRSEAQDHLEQIEANLLTLEKDPTNADTLNGLFRSFHTIKGVSGFLKLTPIQRLAHEVESLMDHARNNKFVLNSSMITLILQAQDTVRAFVQQIADALDKGHMPTEMIPVSHLIAQVQRAIQIGLNATLADSSNVEISFKETSVASPNNAAAAPKGTKPPLPLTQAADALGVKQSMQAPAKAGNHPEGKATNATAENATIRVSTGKLDYLMDMVGELVIVQSQLQEGIRSGQEISRMQRSLGQLSRITKDLQHTAMSLRMVPIKPSFQKVNRMVRDLAKNSNKEVELFLFGEDTELDRNVVEQIGDPLVHMIRNAIDHGVEGPDEREKAGKSRCGRIELKAYHMGSTIVIEMTDDGRGINTAKVLAKAIASGCISEDENLTEKEAMMLIFEPGLSTAEKVTDISGRGVGMDVVKRNIEHMRGSIEVESAIGKGTTFKIKLPLTMAIIDGLIIGVGEDRFIVPTNSVKIALRPTESQITTLQGKAELLHWRGHSIPLIRLYKHFNIPANVDKVTDGIVVILEVFGKSYGLLVDSLVSKQEVVIKNLGNLLQNRPGIAGGAILGDGSISLILDPVGLCAHALK